MSTPIYTDKDYLDAQFLSINLRLDAMTKSMNSRMDEHDQWHKRWGKRVIAIAGVLVTIAGAFWGGPK